MQTQLRGRGAGALPARASRSVFPRIVCQSQKTQEAPKKQQSYADKSRQGLGDIGDLLGPIGLTYSDGVSVSTSSSFRAREIRDMGWICGLARVVLAPVAITTRPRRLHSQCFLSQ